MLLKVAEYESKLELDPKKERRLKTSFFLSCYRNANQFSDTESDGRCC